MRKSDILFAILTCLCYPWLPKPPSREKIERRERERSGEAPKPLPARRRKLTLLSFENEQQKQLQSLFFTKLPAEIRRQIYLEVLWPGAGSSEVHVASSHRRVCSVPCFEKHHDLTGWQHDCWFPAAADGTLMLRDPRLVPGRPHEDRAIPFLSSCRRMYAFPFMNSDTIPIRAALLTIMGRYTEAAPMLYINNTLNVRQLRAIIDMKNTMVLHRFSSIRSLHIDAPLHWGWSGAPYEPGEGWSRDVLSLWEPAWCIISKDMHGLQNLQVTFSQHKRVWGDPITHRTLEHLLRPMMGVVHVQSFLVEIFMPWMQDQVQGVLDSFERTSPFRVVFKEPVDVPGVHIFLA